MKAILTAWSFALLGMTCHAGEKAEGQLHSRLLHKQLQHPQTVQQRRVHSTSKPRLQILP